MSCTSSRPQLNAQQMEKLRERFTQFRILVIGRANAGKTTILRKLCDATGEPMIFDPTGKKVKYMVQVHARYSHLCPWSQIESSTLDPSLEVNGSLLACTSITLHWINILNTVARRAWYPECNDIWDQPWLYISRFPRFRSWQWSRVEAGSGVHCAAFKGKKCEWTTSCNLVR